MLPALYGLVEIPLIFDGNSFCPECYWMAMDVYGGTWFCKQCGARFPGTIAPDRYGRAWLNLNDRAKEMRTSTTGGKKR